MTIAHQQMVIHSVAAAGGDVIDLQDMSALDEGVDGAWADCKVYNVGLNEGEQWFEDGGPQYQNDTITPGANANLYQMKWEPLGGDEPTGNNTVASGVWHPLSSGDFEVEWTASGANEETGSVTVSIRKGTGSVLDTAAWDGEAISTKT